MTRLITPANPFITTEVDVAFDPDLNDPSESWDWTTLGDYTDGPHTRPRLLDQTIEVFHGRRDESRLADPSTVDIKLGNGDSALTPRNPASPYWPGLKRGTPLRVVAAAGAPHLLVTGISGSRASTPDTAALDITGDLSGAIEFLSPLQMPPKSTNRILAGKFATGQRSWMVFLFNGSLWFRWSTDGTAQLTRGSTMSVPCPEAGPLSVGWWIDVSNAGNHVVTFYARRGPLDDLLDDLDASVLGDPVVETGTTSIFSSTTPLEVGDVEGTTFDGYPGRINRFQLRDGNLSSGTVVADLACTTLAVGATGTTDPAGRVWTFSDAEITNRRPRFCGRVDKVAAHWGALDESNPLLPAIASVDVSASGILERLAQEDAIGSALRRAISAPVNQDAVIAAWMFEDGSESTRVAQLVSGAAPMSIRGEFNFGGDTSYAAVAAQMTIGSGENAYMSAPIPEIPQVVGVNWQITAFAKIDEPATDPLGTQLMAIDTNGRTATWRVNINDTQLTVTGIDIDGGGVVLDTITSDPSWYGGEVMVVLEVDDDGANVDWRVVLLTLPAGVGYAVTGTYVGDTGVPRMFRNSCTGPPSGIARGPVIVSVDRDLGWLAPADTAHVGEPAPQRVFRLCQEGGIPVAVDGPYTAVWEDAIAAGAQAMGPQRPGTLLAEIEKCAVADQALVGEQRGALGLTFRSGATLYNQATRLSLARSARQVIAPFEEVDDDQQFVNDVTASRPDGSEYRIEDPAIAAGSVERYQRDVEVNVSDDLALPNQAGWRVHLGGWPEPRFPQVWSDIAKDVSLVEDALGFAVGDRFALVDPPPGCPPVDQIADGIVEELERFQWRVGFNGHPARAWDTFIFDHAERNQPDTDGSELAASFAAGSATTMSVATTVGDLWTTEAGDFPFQVEVDGAVVEVTNITGGSSPQTFTVTTLNGVTRTIAAGKPVKLRHGAVLPL